MNSSVFHKFSWKSGLDQVLFWGLNSGVGSVETMKIDGFAFIAITCSKKTKYPTLTLPPCWHLSHLFSPIFIGQFSRQRRSWKKKAKIHDVNSIVKCYIKLRENEKLWDFDQIQIKAPHLPVISVQLDKATKFSLFYS